MSRRLGEILIDKGLLGPGQLEKALKAQLIFGGHLGTSLIELGYVDESTLGEVLAEITGAPYASFETLLAVPPPVIETIPAKLAEQFRVVPIRLRDRKLLVAAVNPRDLGAMDTIAFVTGHKVVPWVAPEIRIFQALEKYYGIRRPPRYVTICRELDQRGGASERAESPPTPTETPARRDEQPMAAASTTEVTRGPLTDAAASLAAEQAGGPGSRDDFPPSLLDPGLAAMFDAAPVDVDPASLSESWQDIIVQAIESEKERQRRSVQELSPPLRAQCLEQASEQLAEAGSGDDVAAAALSYLSMFAPRAILFAVRDDSASAWRSGRLNLEGDARSGLKFPVLSGSIFELLLGNEYYRGALPGDGGYSGVYRALELEEPAEVLMIPVHVENRLTLILYADGGADGAVGGDTSDYLRFAGKVSMALSMQILRNRIRNG